MQQSPTADPKILDLLEQCKKQIRVSTNLTIVPTDQVTSPALFGFIRPRLLLPPVVIKNLSEEQLRFVILHELAHLKRYDILTDWLMTLVQILHWFNPLIWLAFYRMRADRELACDALVLAHIQSNKSKLYGRTIVQLLEYFNQSRTLPGTAGILENRNHLIRRITMINNFKKSSKKWSVAAMIFIVLLSSVALTNAQHSRHKMKDNATEHMMGGMGGMRGMMGGIGNMRGMMGGMGNMRGMMGGMSNMRGMMGGMGNMRGMMGGMGNMRGMMGGMGNMRGMGDQNMTGGMNMHGMGDPNTVGGSMGGMGGMMGGMGNMPGMMGGMGNMPGMMGGRGGMMGGMGNMPGMMGGMGNMPGMMGGRGGMPGMGDPNMTGGMMGGMGGLGGMPGMMGGRGGMMGGRGGMMGGMGGMSGMGDPNMTGGMGRIRHP